MILLLECASLLDVRVGSGGVAGKLTGVAKVTRDGWVPPNKSVDWIGAGAGAGAVTGGLGKEAKSGAKGDGVLTYMVLMDGGGMSEEGAALMGTGTRDGGDFLNREPTLARNDLAGEGVVWSVMDRSSIPAVRESSSSS